LKKIILEQIWLERNGDIIDRHLIRSCVSILEKFDEFRSFEEEFLKASRDFYREEASMWLRESTARSYCRHVNRRLSEEQDRCRETISEGTALKVLRIAKQELIGDKLAAGAGAGAGAPGRSPGKYIAFPDFLVIGTRKLLTQYYR